MDMRLMLPTFFTIFGSLAWPQATPNFTGHWVLNAQKSTFPTDRSQLPRLEINVTQDRTSIQSEWQLTSSGRSVHLRLHFKTNGTESYNSSGGNEAAFQSLDVPSNAPESGADIFMAGTWHGQELNVTSHWRDVAHDKRQFELDDIWKLSSDRKTLTIDRTSGRDHYGRGVATTEVHTRLVFERAAAPQGK